MVDPSLSTVGRDGCLRLWDLESGHDLVQPLYGYVGETRALAIAERQGRAVIVSRGEERITAPSRSRLRRRAQGTPLSLGQRPNELCCTDDQGEFLRNLQKINVGRST